MCQSLDLFKVYRKLSIGTGDLAEIRSYEKTGFENIDAKEEEIVIQKECKNSIVEDDGNSEDTEQL